MKKLFIFDFDGTLVNTLTDVSICFNKALEYYGFNTHPIEKYEELVGGNLDSIVKNILPNGYVTQDNINKLKLKYKEIYESFEKPNTKMFDGIEDFLRKLQSSGVRIAINSNKSQHILESTCKKIFPNINFDGIIGYVENVPSKPDPSGVYKLMELNCVSKEETIYIGDGETDVRTAENAGVDSVLVTWGKLGNTLKEDQAVKFVACKVEDLFRLI